MDELDAIMGISGVEYDTNSDQELEGLGQKIRQPFSIQQKGVIKKFAAKKTRDTLLQSTASKGQRHMLAKISSLDQQVQADVAAGRAKFVLLDYYFRRSVTTGTNELIKASDIQKVGISNFDKNRVPAGINIDVTHIALAYGYSGTSVTAAEVAYSNAQDAETGGTSPVSVPMAVLNGEIIIKVDGGEVANLPVKKFFRDGLSVTGSLDKSVNAVELSTPILIPQNSMIEAILKCADGIAIGSNYHFLEVRLIGEGIVPKS